MSCGLTPNPDALRDGQGSIIGFMINGTDQSVGVVNMAALPGNFSTTVSPDNLFRVIPETAGVINVILADGTVFTITAVQVDAHIGVVYPANIKSVVKAGTTATFSVVW